MKRYFIVGLMLCVSSLAVTQPVVLQLHSNLKNNWDEESLNQGQSLQIITPPISPGVYSSPDPDSVVSFSITQNQPSLKLVSTDVVYCCGGSCSSNQSDLGGCTGGYNFTKSTYITVGVGIATVNLLDVTGQNVGSISVTVNPVPLWLDGYPHNNKSPFTVYRGQSLQIVGPATSASYPGFQPDGPIVSFSVTQSKNQPPLTLVKPIASVYCCGGSCNPTGGCAGGFMAQVATYKADGVGSATLSLLNENNKALGSIAIRVVDQK